MTLRAVAALATVELVTAAVARIPVFHVLMLPDATMYAATDLFLVAIAGYDVAVLKRMHAATLWGGLFLIASQIVRETIKTTPAWLAFSGWLTT